MLLRIFLLISFITISGCAWSPTTAIVSVPKIGVAPGPGTTSDKVGKATCWNILGIVASGNCTIEAAKENGGITKVTTVDRDNLGVLGLFYRTTLVVKGE